MRNLLPLVLAALTLTAGCQDTSTSATDLSVTIPADTSNGNRGERVEEGQACPLLGISTTVRYEIQSGTERQYRVHLINTGEAPMAADCQPQQPLPGNVVMRYRLASSA